MKKRTLTTLLALLVSGLILAACTPQTVEVTRVVEGETVVETVTEQIEVTRVVEGEVVTEVQEVEVTRVVEADVDPTACNIEPPAEPVEVNMLGTAFPITEFFAGEFEKCNDVENLTVNTQLMASGDQLEQQRLGLSGGGVAPWAIIHTTPDSVEFIDQGLILPLNDLVEKYWEEYRLWEIPQTAWDVSTVDGVIYSVPFMSNTLHMFYRTDLFEQYNLEPPTTYDGVIAACEVLKDEPSIDIPFTMNLHAGWAWDIEFFHFIRSYGGDYLNEDNTPAFNSEAGIAALTKMQEVVDACMGQEGLTYSIDDSEIGMETGGLAFVNIWASRAANMDNPELSDFVGQIGFAPAAAPNPGGALGGSAWLDAYAIPINTDVDHDLAFRIIMEAIDFQSMKEGAEFGITLRTSVAEAGAGARYLPAASETIANGVGSYPPNPAIPLAGAALGNWLPLVGSGELTPEEALQGAAEEYLIQATEQGLIEE